MSLAVHMIDIICLMSLRWLHLNLLAKSLGLLLLFQVIWALIISTQLKDMKDWTPISGLSFNKSKKEPAQQTTLGTDVY